MVDQERDNWVSYPADCHKCMGEGWIVVCPDDVCRGSGECMHGDDGETLCPICGGEAWA